MTVKNVKDEDGDSGGEKKGRLSFNSVLKHKSLAIRMVRERKCQIGRLSRMRQYHRISEAERELGMSKRKKMDKEMREMKAKLNEMIRKAKEMSFQGPKLEVMIKVSWGEEIPMILGLEDMSPEMMEVIDMPVDIREQVTMTQEIIEEVEKERDKVIKKANRQLEKMSEPME